MYAFQKNAVKWQGMLYPFPASFLLPATWTDQRVTSPPEPHIPQPLPGPWVLHSWFSPRRGQRQLLVLKFPGDPEHSSERSVLLKSPYLDNTSKRTPSPHLWSGPQRRDDPNNLYRTKYTPKNLECPMVPESWGNGTLGKFSSFLSFHITSYIMKPNIPVLSCRVLCPNKTTDTKAS